MVDKIINKTISIFYNKKLSSFLEKYLKQFYLIYFLIILFFWNVDYVLFDAKYFTGLIFGLCFLTYIKNLNLLKKKELYLIILFFFTHFFLISIQNNFLFIKENILTYSYLIISIFVVILLYDYLRKNFLLILNSFTFIFNSIFIIFTIVYLQNGGYLNIDCYKGIFSETGFIFEENSHFGLISSAVIFYNTNIILEGQIKKYKNFLLVNTAIFILISFLTISTSFLVTTFLLSIFFLFKNKSLKKKFFYLLLIIASILFLSTKDQCQYRSTDNLKYTIENLKEKEIVDSDYNNKILFTDRALSYNVFFNSIKIGVLTLPKNLLGVGANNYSQLFEKFVDRKLENNNEVNFLNLDDASSNFSKIIGEFGLFGLIFYIYLIFKLVRIDPSNSFQIFLITSIFSQSLRGVGYFTAAFIILTTALFISANDKKNKK